MINTVFKNSALVGNRSKVMSPVWIMKEGLVGSDLSLLQRGKLDNF